MARPGFKAWWTKIVPASRRAQRLRPRRQHHADDPVPRAGGRSTRRLERDASRCCRPDLWALFWIGWLTVLVSTFLINHFELFGLQQAWFNVRGREARQARVPAALVLSLVAHPLYPGFFLAFWATPEMTAGHLLLAGGMSLYMLIAIRYEERDLTDLFGDDYRRYRDRRRDADPANSGESRLNVVYAAALIAARARLRPWTRASPTSATGSSISIIASIRHDCQLFELIDQRMTRLYRAAARRRPGRGAAGPEDAFPWLTAPRLPG